MPMTTLYVAGPMTGLPEWGRPVFAAATDELRAAGWQVLNPCDPLPGDPDTLDGRPWDWWIRRSLRVMLEADGVALLPGWQLSRGASLEAAVAAQVSMPAFELEVWLHRRRPA